MLSQIVPVVGDRVLATAADTQWRMTRLTRLSNDGIFAEPFQRCPRPSEDDLIETLIDTV